MKQLSVQSINSLDIKKLIQYSIFIDNSDNEKLKETVVHIKNEKIEGLMYGFLTHYDNGIESKVYSKHVPFFFIDEKLKKAALSIFNDKDSNSDADKINQLIIIKNQSESHNFPDAGLNQNTGESVITLVIKNNIFEFLVSYKELSEARSNSHLFNSIKSHVSLYEINKCLPVENNKSQKLKKIKI